MVKKEIPFIVQNTFLGQNQMIDIDRDVFLPQNILMSILSVKIHSLITITKIFVFINIILMYFYLPAWWNGAVGQI